MSGLPGLATRALGRDWRHLKTVDSTSDYLKARAGKLPHGAAVTASEQTGGRGRLGRGWSGGSPDEGLALSVLLQGHAPQALGPLPLVAGLAVCEGLETLCGVRCDLKWSNDVLLGGKKLCGILCESGAGPGGPYAVVGIGLNLRRSKEDFARLGLVYATSLLSATGACPAPAAVAAAVLNSLEPLLDKLWSEGFSALRGRYRDRCATLGRQVRVLWQGEQREGVALDIADSGALLCNIDGAVRAVTAGEASVRGLCGYAD